MRQDYPTITHMALRVCWIMLVIWSLLLTGLFALRPSQPEPLLKVGRYDIQGFLIEFLDLPTDRQYTFFAGSFVTPFWSPDGRWMLYTVQTLDERAYSYAVDLETGVTHLLDFRINWMYWSPDGQHLLYEFDTAGLVGYAEQSANGFKRVMEGAIRMVQPVWSPDGTWIYFLDSRGKLQRIAAEHLTAGDPDSHVESISTRNRWFNQLLGWMPDGETLMVIAPALDITATSQVYALNLETGQMQLLVEFPLPGVSPVWSPDGAMMAASLYDPNQGEGSEPLPAVYLIDGATGDHTLIWAGIAGQLTWSPDGQQLAFELTDRFGSRRSVWLYHHDAGQIESVTPDQQNQISPEWVVYRGRRLDMWPLAGFCGILLAGLWVIRRRV